jgi:predicted transcriptional regulator
MPAKPLTDEQLEDAARLRRAFDDAKARDASLTQEVLAFECGWKTQGAVSQYLKGKIPLNFEAAYKFSVALKVWIEDISPSLAQRLAEMVVKVGPNTSPLQKQVVSASPNELARLIQFYGIVSDDAKQRILDFAEAEASGLPDPSPPIGKRKKHEHA